MGTAWRLWGAVTRWLEKVSSLQETLLVCREGIDFFNLEELDTGAREDPNPGQKRTVNLYTFYLKWIRCFYG